MARTVLYKLESSLPSPGRLGGQETDGFRFEFWRPSILRRVPPGKGKKYLFYWLFHYLRVFRNRDYSAVLVYEGDILASSLLVVPAYYKWPFMADNDLQLTYVLPPPDYRGRGLAELAVRLAIQENIQERRAIWYVTNSENIASRNLCEKVGFGLFSFGVSNGFMKVLKPCNDMVCKDNGKV